MFINDVDFIVPRFSSGEMKLKIDDLTRLIKNNSVKIVYNGEISIFELFIIIKYYKSIGTQVTLYLGYLPYQRMDKHNDIEVCTLELVAQIINSLDIDQVFVCEPHCNLQPINNAKPICLVYKLLDIMKKDLNLDGTETLIFPDKGSANRYSKVKSKNTVYFEKVRSLDTGLIISHQMRGELSNSNRVIIVDDIVSTGDTLINIINTIPNNKDIFVVCGHFEQNKYNQRLTSNPQIKAIYTSNSLTKEPYANLKIFDIKDLIK